MKMKELCVRLCCAVIGFSLLVVCHYPPSDFTAEGLEEKTENSLAHLFRYHYTWSTNLEVLDDSVRLEYPPVKDAYVSLSKDDRVVMAEFSIRPRDNADSVWVKLTHPQNVQGWVHSRDLVCSFVPTGGISQFIHLFSNTHVSHFVITFVLFVGAYLLRASTKKQLQMVYSDDVGSICPLSLCLLMAFSATIYKTMQVFVLDT